MGRLESLTVAALGRSPYEDRVVETAERERQSSSGSTPQFYDEHGHPINPETKRRQREQTRASNEVMQATGVVEESSVTKAKERALREEEEKETIMGLRLLEFGRAALVGGVWGVLGLRRRILLYKPYERLSFLEIVRQERAIYPKSLLFAGIPTVMAYHVSDWIGFVCQVLFDGFYEDSEDSEDSVSPRQIQIRHVVQRLLDLGFCYLTLQFRMFAILQQLNLIPPSRLLPSFKSFIPFSVESPLQLPPPPSLALKPFISWTSSVLQSAGPLAVIFAHAKVKFWIARRVNGVIYKCLPRPTKQGSDGRTAPKSFWESDMTAAASDQTQSRRGADEPTLRALEGRPAMDRGESRTQQIEFEPESSDDEDGEIPHATLISFDVEATDAGENSMGSMGSWSAELRSANEPKPSTMVTYRFTALTMLPPFLAAEGLSEIVAGVILLPFEAAMVRIIGRAYRRSEGLGVSDLYDVFDKNSSFRKMFSAFALQLAVAGVVWIGTTVATEWLSVKRIEKSEDENTIEA